MNYYDELGVRRDASTQEIRQAYKVMVRLLHPDTQSDGALRLAAERQLSRLNAMIAVLSTPELRRAYDLQLDQESSRRLAPGPLRPTPEFAPREENATGLVTRAKPLVRLVFRHWSFILIGAVTCGAAVATLVLYSENEASPGPGSVETVQTAAAAPKPTAAKQFAPRPARIAAQQSPAGSGAPQEDNPSARVRPAVSVKSAAKFIVEPHPQRTAPYAGSPATVAAAPVEPSPGESPVPAPPAAVASAQVSYAGNWFYAVDLDPSKESAGYRAVYVELLLSERGEALFGSYRARYLIPDKAISPEVSFHLEGKTGSGRTAKAQWTAANGARGEAELNVSASGVMDFHWWTVEISDKPGLTSGTARLVRQRIP